MSRFDLTRILKPTGLQPPLTGPRDALPATVHKLAGDEDETPTATTPKGNTMTNAQRILAALAKKSPADLTYLEKATGISRGVLGVTLPLLVKGKAIERSPHQRGIYGLPGTTFLIGGGAAAKATKAASSTKRTYGKRKPKAGSPESFAAGVKAIEREQASTGTNGTSLLARVERVNGVDHPDGARLARALIMRHEATALPCRAIATAAGGAIVLRGNTLTAELSAEEVNVIHQLRG